MRPVDQTKFVADPESDECGNCMQAAVASLLELTLDDVPHFAAEPDDEWWWTFVKFCRSLERLAGPPPADGVGVVERSPEDHVHDGRGEPLDLFDHERGRDCVRDGVREFKIDNSVVSRLSRALMDEFPELAGVFQTRELRS